MILIIDNYDSFSYNLFQLIGEINPDIKIIRNDAMSVEEVVALAPSHIILSPGPGKPADAGICVEVVQKLHKDFPILGVCLGHQAICEAFGGTVSHAKKMMHGKQSPIKIVNQGIFSEMDEEITVARYHSLALKADTLPTALVVTGQTMEENEAEREIMAVAHKEYPVYGVQFHPESILTPQGRSIIKNFIGVSHA